MTHGRDVLRALVLGFALALGACGASSGGNGDGGVGDTPSDTPRFVWPDLDTAGGADAPGSPDGAPSDTPARADATGDTPARPDAGPGPDTAAPPDASPGSDAPRGPDGLADAVPDTAGPPDAPAGPDAADAAADGGTPFVCHEKLKVLYVIDKAKTLFRFDPRTAIFDAVGEVDCGEFLDTTPGSMAVSRGGVAYVNYSSAELFGLNIDDATCSATGWTPFASGFGRFGMGFVTDDLAGGDILYVANEDTLARIDLATWNVAVVGPLPSQCELSGNANGELWGFFPLENPPQIRQLDRSTAAALVTYDLPPLPADLDTFAFAYWGGDFYLFYRENGMGNSTAVYRYRPGGTLELVLSDTGHNIVGAGVSTCVPTTH